MVDYSSFYDNLVKKMSNLFHFILVRENEILRNKFYYQILIVIFYCQIAGMLFSVSLKSADQIFTKIFF